MLSSLRSHREHTVQRRQGLVALGIKKLVKKQRHFRVNNGISFASSLCSLKKKDQTYSSSSADWSCSFFLNGLLSPLVIFLT